MSTAHAIVTALLSDLDNVFPMSPEERGELQTAWEKTADKIIQRDLAVKGPSINDSLERIAEALSAPANASSVWDLLDSIDDSLRELRGTLNVDVRDGDRER